MSENNEVALNSDKEESEQIGQPEQEETENEPADQNFNSQVDEQRQQYQPTKLESFFAITKSLILRALVIYFISSFFRKPATTPVESNGTAALTRTPAINIFENGTELDMYVYVNEAENLNAINKSDSLVWTKKGLIYGEWNFGPNEDNALFHKTTIKTTENIKNNGSLYMHVFMTLHGENIDLSKNSKTIYVSKQLNRFKKLRYVKTHNLLTGESTASAEEIKKAETLKEEIISHWHPNITINIVVDYTNWLEGSVPMPLDEYINFLPGGDKYKPVVYINDYWNMIRDYHPINQTTDVLELDLSFQPLSLFKWQLYCAQAMRNRFSFFGDTQEDDEHDSLKEALIETSPYLLALTLIVSLLHSVFELLAFKNDIQFWNNRKSLEGLSVRSVFFNVFQSTVVLLYVLDNDTNTVVRLSCFVGLGIEIWKIHKVMDIKIDRQNKLFNIIPKIHFHDKGSYVHSSTREYDMMAFKYLSWALYPLLFGYIVYSLFYQEHRGWYSFVLNILYGFLLTFGFIMMTPQLFINYKLKSVAHLPWRMMSYKFLNTFIDDIFAFVIKMPTLYRLGCFRDDIVFFIFLYQRWIYKTDLSRLNEYGFSGEMEQAASVKNPPQLAITQGPSEACKPKKKEETCKEENKNKKSTKDPRQKKLD